LKIELKKLPFFGSAAATISVDFVGSEGVNSTVEESSEDFKAEFAE
jgi:hypothetical protein